MCTLKLNLQYRNIISEWQHIEICFVQIVVLGSSHTPYRCTCTPFVLGNTLTPSESSAWFHPCQKIVHDPHMFFILCGCLCVACSSPTLFFITMLVRFYYAMFCPVFLQINCTTKAMVILSASDWQVKKKTFAWPIFHLRQCK